MKSVYVILVHMLSLLQHR